MLGFALESEETSLIATAWFFLNNILTLETKLWFYKV